MSRSPGAKGFTLVESLVAAAVLSVAVAAIAAAIMAGLMQGQHAGHAQRAVRLAEDMTEYILSLPYYDPQGSSNPGPEAGEIQPTGFDNADDFHGYGEPAGQVKDPGGTLYPEDYQVFSRRVTAEYGSQTVPGLGNPIPGLTVTVTVQDQAGRTWSLTRFVAQPAG